MRHNPFVYFDSIRQDPVRRLRGIVPLTQLGEDLKQNRLPELVFIMPNLCHSSHDCGLEVADLWLGWVVESILGSPAFDPNSLLVLTFDEGITSLGRCGSQPQGGGGHIATVLISPLVKPGFQDPTPYSHYSLLKTIEAAWGLEELGRTSDPSHNMIIQPWQR